MACAPPAWKHNVACRIDVNVLLAWISGELSEMVREVSFYHVIVLLCAGFVNVSVGQGRHAGKLGLAEEVICVKVANS